MCFREQAKPSTFDLFCCRASQSFLSMKSSSWPWLRLSSPWWGTQVQKVAARIWPLLPWKMLNQEPQASTMGLIHTLLAAALEIVRCRRAQRGYSLYFPGIARREAHNWKSCVIYSTCSEIKAEAGVGMGKGSESDWGMEIGLLQHIVCPCASAPFCSSSAMLNGKCTSGIPQWFRGMGASKELLTLVQCKTTRLSSSLLSTKSSKTFKST